MKKILTFFLFLSCITAGLYAKGPGSTSGTTLLIPVFPQAAGMAEACSSLTGDLMLISYNPAGLAEFTGTEVAALHNRGMADDHTSAIILGKRFSFASFAAAIIYYTTGEIELYDSIGDLKKKVGQEDILVIISNAEKIKSVSLGLSIKFLSSSIFGKSAFSYAADLGAQYKLLNILNLGLSVQNLGSKLIYLGDEEDLPLLIRPGISWDYDDPSKSFAVAIDMPYNINEGSVMIHLGVSSSFDKQLSFRMGHKTNLSRKAYTEEKFNIGWGIDLKYFKFDHSVAITKKLNFGQMFSVSTAF